MPCARLPIEWQPSLAKLRWPPSLQIIVTRMWPLCCVVLCCVVTTVFWPECDHCVAIHRTTIWPSSLSSCQCHTKNFAWENICLWFCPLPLPFALALCPDLFALIFALALAFLLHLFLLLHFDLFRFWQQNVRGGSSLTLVYWSSPPQPQNAPHQQGGAAPALQHLQLYLGRLEVSHPDHHLPWGQIECPGAPPLHLRNAFATQHGAPSASRASHLKPGQHRCTPDYDHFPFHPTFAQIPKLILTLCHIWFKSSRNSNIYQQTDTKGLKYCSAVNVLIVHMTRMTFFVYVY